MSDVRDLIGKGVFKKHGRGPDKKKRKPKRTAKSETFSDKNPYLDKIVKDLSSTTGPLSERKYWYEQWWRKQRKKNC